MRPKPPQVRKSSPLEGSRRFPTPRPQTQAVRPGPAGAAPPPGAEPSRPRLRARRAAPGTRHCAPYYITRPPKAEGFHAPIEASSRRLGYSPRGTEVLPYKHRWPPAAWGTQTRAPCSGRREDPHPLPSPPKGESGSHLLLGPRPARGTRIRAPSPSPRQPGPRPLPKRAGHLPPQPRGPSPSLTQSSVPQLMVQGAGRGAPRGGRGSPVPLPGDPFAPRDPRDRGKPRPAQPPRPPARRCSPRVSSAAPPPGRSSAKWPEEAAARQPQRPPARPTPGEQGEGVGRAWGGRGGAGAGPHAGAGPADSSRTRRGPPSPRCPPPSGRARGCGRTPREAGGVPPPVFFIT